MLSHCAVYPVIGLPPSPPAVNTTDTAPTATDESVTTGAAGVTAGTVTVGPKPLNGLSPTALVALTRHS